MNRKEQIENLRKSFTDKEKKELLLELGFVLEVAIASKYLSNFTEKTMETKVFPVYVIWEDKEILTRWDSVIKTIPSVVLSLAPEKNISLHIKNYGFNTHREISGYSKEELEHIFEDVLQPVSGYEAKVKFSEEFAPRSL